MSCNNNNNDNSYNNNINNDNYNNNNKIWIIGMFIIFLKNKLVCVDSL